MKCNYCDGVIHPDSDDEYIEMKYYCGILLVATDYIHAECYGMRLQ